MSGTPMMLGPFAGGINNRTDAASLQDNELQDSINFIHGVDGTLLSRYPIEVADKPEGLSKRLLMLGYTIMYGPSMTLHTVAIGSNDTDGTWACVDGTWTQISDRYYQNFVAYGKDRNKLFFPTNNYDDTEYGGFWTLYDTEVTEVDTTPKGLCMCVHKNRLWVAGDRSHPSRLYYSAVMLEVDLVAHPEHMWDLTPPDPQQDDAGFIDVNPGTGEGIRQIWEYNDAIVIFKDDSTFILNYDISIARGQLVQINDAIGTFNQLTVAEYKNSLVVYHEGKVYAYNNGNFSQINERTRLTADVTYDAIYSEPISISVFGDHLLVRHYDQLYYMSFLTGGWGRWQSAFPIGNMVEKPVFVGDETKEYLISSVDPTVEEVYSMKLEWAEVEEVMVCYALTKVFDFDAPYAYKRLFWWGIDAATGALPVYGRATPVAVSFAPTWGDILLNKWGFYLDHTWGHLLDTLPSVTTGPIFSSASTTTHRMYKFLKGLRFRQIAFAVVMGSDGTATNGPQRLIRIVPFVNVKEGVVKQVS